MLRRVQSKLSCLKRKEKRYKKKESRRLWLRYCKIKKSRRRAR
jgi:hypothetical protein